MTPLQMLCYCMVLLITQTVLDQFSSISEVTALTWSTSTATPRISESCLWQKAKPRHYAEDNRTEFNCMHR